MRAVRSEEGDLTADNVHESWLSDTNVGVNGPVDRNEGAYNG